MVPKCKYLGRLDPGPRFKLCGSRKWVSLKQEWAVIKKGSSWAIGNGVNTKIWIYN